MASITITIPDSIAQRTLNGFCTHYGYQATLENGTPNPQTKLQFSKAKLIEIIREAVRATEIQVASNQAAATASASVDSDIQLS